MYAMLETFPQKKIIVTNANSDEQKEYGMIDLPYELFTLSHSPNKTDPLYFQKLFEHYGITAEDVVYFEHNIEAVMSATSLGISAYHYDPEKKDIAWVEAFLRGELWGDYENIGNGSVVWGSVSWDAETSENQTNDEYIALEKKLKDTEEIAKKAQYDYFMVKWEFDSYVRRVEAETKESKVNQLVDVAKKLLPIVDQLWQSVHHMPADLESNTWASGVKLTYDNALKILGNLGITQIPTIGEEPNMELHEPLSVEPIEDDALKGKIVREFQPWYVYEKDGVTKVITAAKVIVGQ